MQDASQLLDGAERAAAAGDFESAFELLQRAVRRQEIDLGPDHPDLANTLNNLAIVAEKTGRVSEAEPLYRRAAAIAQAAFAADHPMAVASQQNLEEFCRAHDLPVVPPAAVTPPTPPPPATLRPQPAASLSPESQPVLAQSSERPANWRAAVAGGVVVLIVVALLVFRSGSSRDASPPGRTPPSAAPQSAEPSAPVAPAAPRPASPTRSEQVTAQLCRNFSTNGRRWHCDPVGESVGAGRLALYTRIKSARNGAVVHRWYREGTLRQSVRLATRASATDGYRTYSRQTVNAGDWRVEVRGTDGTLLHEQRFVVG